MVEVVSSHAKDREALMQLVGASLQNLIRKVETALEKAAKAQNLHPTDFSCIGLLHRARTPVSPKLIIESLNMSSGSGTALLDRLELQGFIRRVPNPKDRRSVLIELDEANAAEPLRKYREIEDRYRHATQNMPNRDLEVVFRYLEEISSLTDLT